MNRSHALRHLIHVDRRAAGELILRAIEEAKGHKGGAADLLGCRHGTMLKWIRLADIESEVDALIEKLKSDGTHERGSSSVASSRPRPFEVVDRKTGLPIGPGGFSTMESAVAKAKEEPKRWRAQRKPALKARQARTRARAAA